MSGRKDGQQDVAAWQLYCPNDINHPHLPDAAGKKMAATAVASAVAKIPWKQILVLLPEVARAAKDIRRQWDSKSKPAPLDPATSITAQISVIARRVEALERNERAQSAVISQIADQLEGLAGGLRETAERQTLILRLCIASLVIASCALVVAVVVYAA